MRVALTFDVSKRDALHAGWVWASTVLDRFVCLCWLVEDGLWQVEEAGRDAYGDLVCERVLLESYTPIGTRAELREFILECAAR